MSDRPIWDDAPEPAEDFRRRPTVTKPCRRCNTPVTATASKLRPFCGWQCHEAYTELESRFRRKVGDPVVHLVHLGPCTDWTGKLDDEGYGRIRSHDVFRLAHRVSYELEHGIVPDDLMICHRCSRRRCVSPAHLYAGTALDNMRDLALDNSGSGSKTDWAERLEMAQAIVDGGDPEMIGAGFSVSGKTALGWVARFRDRDRVPDHLVLVEPVGPRR